MIRKIHSFSGKMSGNFYVTTGKKSSCFLCSTQKIKFYHYGVYKNKSPKVDLKIMALISKHLFYLDIHF